MAAGGGDEYWWATLDILAGREEKKPRKDIMADVEDWLTKITAKIAKQRRIALESPKQVVVPVEPLQVPTKKEAVVPVKKIEVTPMKTLPPEYQYIQTSFGDHIEIEFCFNNPRIRSRLEKLMGSNVVRITDRKYMIKLQERIKEDHLENQKKRIQEREAEEVEREKKLILEGKIPIESAPKELKNHPLCKINQITKKILEDKKVKVKSQNRSSSSKAGTKKMKETGEKSDRDETNEAKKEELDGKEGPLAADESTSAGTSETEQPEDLGKELILRKDEYEKLKYEAPLVKMLKKVENVEEMYKLAEEIVGPLKHQKTSK